MAIVTGIRLEEYGMLTKGVKELDQTLFVVVELFVYLCLKLKTATHMFNWAEMKIG
jgi:hypothetical protein